MIRQKAIYTPFLYSILLLFLAACGTAGPANYEDVEITDAASENDGEDNIDVENEENDIGTEMKPNTSPDSEGTLVQVEAASAVQDGEVTIGLTSDGHAYRGDINAPVIIEAFSDYQCPFCARFAQQTLPSLIEDQITNGEVLFIFYDFPLESIHPQAFAAANAARCAGDQDVQAYWNMHDMLFEQIQLWSVSNPNPIFAEFAEELEIDLEKFNNCLENSEFSAQIEADLDVGAQRGVRSTPSFFINGESLVGAQPLEIFNQAIETVKNGDRLAADPGDTPESELPLEPPRVAPTPAVIRADDVAASLGDSDAPVTIVEYTDYQCPFCQRHVLETMPGILSEMVETGRAQYILKDLPLDNIHPEARTAAVVARCAGEQDAYWPMHDAIFENQDLWSGKGDAAADVLISLADDLGIDQEALASCVAEGKYSDAIQSNIDEAQSLGANATPYFFINGLPVPGAQPFELFAYAIDLAEAGLLAQAYEPGEPDVSDSYAIGDPDAPVVIIEYTDFQCPFCKRHYEQSFGQIKEKFVDEGLVLYIFKDFPLTNIHPQAVKAAEAARCAGDQEAYPQMHGKLFSSQDEWSGSADAGQIFVGYAKELNLDTDNFASCLESGQYESAVMQDLEEGSQLGVSGTPAFFINGHSMSGAQPFAIFEQAINKFLAEQ